MLPMYQRIGQSAFKKDLTNTKKLCKYLNHPQKKFKSIHIAGTNGKGSSSHMLAAVLSRAGYKTGLYTSPHLKHFNERIRIDGIPVPESFIVDFVNSMKPVIGQVNPSFFELTVVMAFEYFAREEVDFAVIEVGLGGRLDSTNVILPEASLITNISYDHQEMLGDTLEEIAAEKAGIIKKKVPVVIGEENSITGDVFTKMAHKMKAPLTFASRNYKVTQIRVLGLRQEIEILDQRTEKSQRLLLETGGLTQLKNIPGVLGILSELIEKGYTVPEKDIISGLQNYQEATGLKGRWQVLHQSPVVIADIAHNKAGLENVIGQVLGLEYRKLHFVLGFMKEKDIGSILPLFPKNASYVFCQPNVPRSMDARWLALQAALFDLESKVIKDVNKAISYTFEKAGENDVVFIGGSTFVVAEVKNL